MSVAHSRGHRNLTCFLPTLLGVVCCANLAAGQIPDLPGWELTWNDEFDGTTLNTQNWVALDRRNSFNGEKQYYHPDQVTVAGGNLQITAIDVPREGKAYQSGLITSNDLFGPGRFEARVDLPTSQGMWPAFWLNANQVPWPQGGEIDIMENRGSQPYRTSSAYHWQTNPGPCCGQHQYVIADYTATEGGQPVNFHAGFHTYAAEWDETTIRYYVDDNLYHTVTETANRPIFETAKNIIVNLAVGGDFGGDPDGSTVWPQTMLVDYVRVWQPSVGVPGDLLLNGDFEDGLSSWTAEGNTFHHEHNLSWSPQFTAIEGDGGHAAKLYGGFGGPQSRITQGLISAAAGETVTLSASARVNSDDSIAGTQNSLAMSLRFFDADLVEIGAESATLVDGNSANDVWLASSVEAVVPFGAVALEADFQFLHPAGQGGAAWLDGIQLLTSSPLVLGDMNGDGTLNNIDISAFALALIDRPQYSLTYPELNPNELGDFSGDGVLNNFDISGFAAALVGGTPVSATAVPEPATALVGVFGALGLVMRRRRAAA